MKQLKTRELEVTLEENKNVIMVCSTPFCGACKMLSSYIEKDFETKYPDVLFCKFDVMTDTYVAEKYEVTNVPAILFFVKGVLKDRNDGFLLPPDLEKFIEKSKDNKKDEDDSDQIQENV